MACLICERKDVPSFYDLDGTTVHSLTPLKTFTAKLMCIPLNDNENKEEICEYCYISLNEIDYMEKKIQDISEELKKRYHEKQSHVIKNGSSPNIIDDDETDREFRCESPLETETKPKTIHFGDYKDLKNILNDNIKEESISSDEKDNTKVDILYDMMDEKNFEIVITKQEGQLKKEEKENKCSQTQNQELKSHSSKQNEKKTYICEVCGKVYPHKTALDIHIGMHRGINPFSCRHCNKTFTQKGALRRHVKIHTGEKPFQCEQCGKCFTHHTSFNIHKKSHSGEKSYKCEICSLALISTSHLKRHMRVHTGEKKYVCSTCGKRFAERYNLVTHQKLHTMSRSGRSHSQKKKFKCEICDASFPKLVELEDHMKNHPTDNLNSNYMVVFENFMLKTPC